MLNKPPVKSPSADGEARRRELLNQCGRDVFGTAVAQVFNKLRKEALIDLPRPGTGRTLARWRVLADLATHNLVLAKLVESHADALAILDELQPRQVPPVDSTWGVWASESNSKLLMRRVGAEDVILTGLKRWCSAANAVSHALVTAWQADGSGPFLVKISMKQPGFMFVDTPWKAVGMANTASVDVQFDGVHGEVIGSARDYLTRPGFWQGAAGVAACWHGGAVSLAHSLRKALAGSPENSATEFRRAALGEVDVTCSTSVTMLRHAAAWIDSHPFDDASTVALRVRRQVEHGATQVLAIVGQAMGAAPFGHDEQFAHIAADLPVYLRQSGGHRDAVDLGSRAANSRTALWTL